MKQRAPIPPVNASHLVVGTMFLDVQSRGRDEQRLALPVRPGPRILILDDSAPDVELTEHVLREDGLNFSSIVIERREAFEAELERQPPDLILSEYTIGGFDGRQAMEMAKRKAPNTPFIFVSGMPGEHVAIELLKQGATDYVLKTHRARLGPAVTRALREAQERRDREDAEAKLRSSHEQLRALANYLHTVREEERTRISRQVHDELGQALTGLKLDLSWLSGKLRRSGDLKVKIEGMSAHIDETINTVRRISTDLRPGVLDSLGLVAAIEWQAGDFQKRTSIPCLASIDVKQMLVNSDLTTVCFRIFQETLTNIVRHAGASRVDVRLAETEGQLVLTVRDNGRGISEREINGASIGLVGMRERAAQVGGVVFFFGLPMQGTTVTMRAPLVPKTPPPKAGVHP